MGTCRQSSTHRLTPHTSHLTTNCPKYSDNMFIEDEADAVFNEIKNLRKDSEETFTTNDELTPTATDTKAASPVPMVSIKVDVESRAEEQPGDCDDVELEEPVSPPACDPSEGPPLLFSQSIEELAAVIVKENRPEKVAEVVPQCVNKRTVTGATSKTVPALIPLTVSEFAERPSVNSPSTLHMSGGGVYTTDCYYKKNGPTIIASSTSSTSSISTTSTTPNGSGQPSPKLSVIKKLPVSTAAPVPAKKRSIFKSKTALAEDKEKEENILGQFYKKSSLISEAQMTIKLSDGLEITPIITVPTLGSTEQTKKRSHESTDNDHNQASKRARNDLVIEKIPRKNTEKEQAEQLNNHQTNEQALNCKLVISRLDKKAKLVFENGIEVPISKNIFKHIMPSSKPTTAQSNRIRRKTARARKISNTKSDSKSNLEEEPEVRNDDKTTGNPEPSAPADMPLIVDSTKVEFPESSRDTNFNSK